MAATDSTLKTMMYLGETQRQANLDFVNQVNSGFQAMSEGIKIQSEISRSMVASAADFKRTQIDEWYKGEQLKLQVSNLALREKMAQANIDIKKQQLEMQGKRIAALDAQREGAKEYSGLLGDLGAEEAAIGGQASELAGVSDKISIQMKSLEEEMSKLDKSYKNGEILSKEEYDDRVNALNGAYENLKSQRLGIIDKGIELSNRKATIAGIEAKIKGKSSSVEDLYDEFYKYKESQYSKPKDSSNMYIDENSKTILRNSGIDVDGKTQPQPKIYALKSVDLERQIQNENRDFDPEYIRDKILPKLESGEKEKYHDKIKSYEIQVAKSLIGLNSTKDFEEGIKDWQPVIKQIDRWSSVNDKLIPFSAKIKEARRIAGKMYSTEHEGSSPGKDEDLDPYIDTAINQVFGLNKQSDGSPPKSAAETAGAAAASGNNKDIIPAGFGTNEPVEKPKNYTFTVEAIEKEIYPEGSTNAKQRHIDSGEYNERIKERAWSMLWDKHESQLKDRIINNNEDRLKYLYNMSVSDLIGNRYAQDIEVTVTNKYSGSGYSMEDINQIAKERRAYLYNHPEEAAYVIILDQMLKDPDAKKSVFHLGE